MKYITALLVALVAMVGVAFGESYTIDENLQSASNGVNIYVGGGSNGYYYPYDYYYPYGGAGFTEVYQSPVTISQSITQVMISENTVGGIDGADGQDGADGEPADNVPAADTTEQPVAAPVALQVAVAPNGMQLVDGGQSLQNEVMDSPIPLEYVTYMDYNVLVVETRGVPTDVAQKFGVAAITNHGYKAVYFVQGLLVRADGSLENKTLDLTTPPRVARSLGYL